MDINKYNSQKEFIFISYMDKSLMLRDIQNTLKFTKDKDFAEYLGIKATVLSNWYKRSSFDNELLYTKCDFLNPHWLLTGKGEMLLQDQGKLTGVSEASTTKQQESTAIEDIIAAKVVERLQPTLDKFQAIDIYLAEKKIDELDKKIP